MKQIPGCNGYMATTDGTIFSLKSKKILKTDRKISNSGYMYAYLGNLGLTAVHCAVALAFLGTPRDGYDHVNHIDGNKKNNKPENLEWVSRSENMKHAFSSGLVKPYDRSGTKNPMSKLTEEDMIELVRLRKLGWTTTALGKHFDIYPGAAGKALKRVKQQ